MAEWKHKLRLTDVWSSEEFSLEDKSLVIAARVRALPGFSLDSPGNDELHELLEELEDAGQADDERWFDQVWSAFYDWADTNRVWVETSR